jgi:hypothetical protein
MLEPGGAASPEESRKALERLDQELSGRSEVVPVVEGEERLRHSAYHEAGHVVAALFYGWNVKRVWIGQYDDPSQPSARTEFEDGTHPANEWIVVNWAGLAAEELALGGFLVRVVEGSEPTDQLRAREIAQRWGIEYDAREWYQKAMKLLQSRRTSLNRMAKALQKRKELNGDEISRVVRGWSGW